MSNLQPMRARDIIVQAVTSLPTGSDRYEGREVDYHPAGALSASPVWRCVWRGALNGGSGAWAVQGEPLIKQVSIGGSHPNTGSTPIFVGNGVEVAVPAEGLYWFEFDYAGYWDALAEVSVTLRVDDSSATPTSGTKVAEWYVGRIDASLWPGTYARGMSLGHFAVSAGHTARMVLARAAGSGNVYCYAGAIYCHPLELRP